MSKTEKFLGLGVLIAIVIAAVALFGVGSKASLGAVAPTDLNSTNFTQLTASDGLAVGSASQFQVGSTGSLVQSGGVSATTTNGSTVIPYSLFDTENVILITQNVGASMTATLPSASAITKLVNVGDSFDVVVINGTTTAFMPLTLAKGANMQLLVASSSATGVAGTKILNAGDMGKLTFTLATSTSFVTAFYTPFK